MYLIGLELARVRADAAGRGDRVHPRRGLPAARRRCGRSSTASHPIDEIAAALLRRAVLPLPRPPHRAARRARRRAEAEGDLLHPDRGLLGRRDEARADRAARGGDAGRRRRDADEHRLRQDRLEHPGDARPRRARDRDRDRGQRGDPAPRRRRDLRPEARRRSCRRRSRRCRCSCSPTGSPGCAA